MKGEWSEFMIKKEYREEIYLIALVLLGLYLSLIENYYLFTQRKFLIINYNVTHLFFYSDYYNLFCFNCQVSFFTPSSKIKISELHFN